MRQTETQPVEGERGSKGVRGFVESGKASHLFCCTVHLLGEHVFFFFFLIMWLSYRPGLYSNASAFALASANAAFAFALAFECPEVGAFAFALAFES